MVALDISSARLYTEDSTRPPRSQFFYVHYGRLPVAIPVAPSTFNYRLTPRQLLEILPGGKMEKQRCRTVRLNSGLAPVGENGPLAFSMGLSDFELGMP